MSNERSEIPSGLSMPMQFLLALAVILTATGARVALDELFGDRYPYSTYMLAIVFMGWYTDLKPAMFTLILGFLTGTFLFVEPRYSFAVHGMLSYVGIGIYLLMGFSCVIFSHLMHRAHHRAEHTASELSLKKVHLEHEITERTSVQKAYIELLRRFVTAQENERRRISRELHDQFGQDLTALNLSLKSLENRLPPSSETRPGLTQLQSLVDRISQDVHHLALELRPPALDDLGLYTAIVNYLEEWSMRTKIPVDFASQGLNRERFSSEVETAIYRSLQEALNNIAKHASSPRVSVILELSSEGLLVIIEDQGVGFDLESTLQSDKEIPRLGLLGLRERIESVGGTLEIESVPGTGTTLYARIPHELAHVSK